MEWISVKDTLPERQKDVLCYTLKGNFTIGYYDCFDDGSILWFPNSYEADFFAKNEVTHWMFLQSPKEGI